MKIIKVIVTCVLLGSSSHLVAQINSFSQLNDLRYLSYEKFSEKVKFLGFTYYSKIQLMPGIKSRFWKFKDENNIIGVGYCQYANHAPMLLYFNQDLKFLENVFLALKANGYKCLSSNGTSMVYEKGKQFVIINHTFQSENHSDKDGRIISYHIGDDWEVMSKNRTVDQ